MAAVIGLVVRSDKLKTMYPSKRSPGTSSSSSTSSSFLDIHSLMTLIMVGCTYYCAVCMIVGNIITTVTSYYNSSNTTGMGDTSNNNIPDVVKSGIVVSDGICMIFHITAQTFLIRSSSNRCNNKLRQVFAFLILANFSIWILEVNQISVKFDSTDGNINLDILPALFMSLNRFYSALMFIHFWKSK